MRLGKRQHANTRHQTLRPQTTTGSPTCHRNRTPAIATCEACAARCSTITPGDRLTAFAVKATGSQHCASLQQRQRAPPRAPAPCTARARPARLAKNSSLCTQYPLMRDPFGPGRQAHRRTLAWRQATVRATGSRSDQNAAQVPEHTDCGPACITNCRMESRTRLEPESQKNGHVLPGRAAAGRGPAKHRAQPRCALSPRAAPGRASRDRGPPLRMLRRGKPHRAQPRPTLPAQCTCAEDVSCNACKRKCR